MLDDGWRSSARRWGFRWVTLGFVLLGACAWGQEADAAPTAASSAEVKLHDVAVKVTASSVLADAKNPGRYGPANLLDEDPNTIWAEGAKSTGAGEWVELSFPPGTPVYAFLVTPGNPKSASLYLANARPRKAKLELKLAEGRKLDYELDFPKNFPAGGAIYVGYHREWAVESARLTVVSVWPGSKYKDLCLGSFVPVFQRPEGEFPGQHKELAPTLAAFMRHSIAISDFLPAEGSGESAWLRAYPEVRYNGPLPEPQLEIDMVQSSRREWARYRNPLSGDVAGARVQSDLFRLAPGTGKASYVLDPIAPPKKPDAFSNFRITWSLVDGEWRIVGVDLKFREETPD